MQTNPNAYEHFVEVDRSPSKAQISEYIVETADPWVHVKQGNEIGSPDPSPLIARRGLGPVVVIGALAGFLVAAVKRR